MSILEVYGLLNFFKNLVVYSSLLLCVSLTFLITRQAIRTYRTYESYKKYNIPGPKPKILVGNMFDLTKDNALPYLTIGKWLKKYGNVVLYFTGNAPTIVIKDPDTIKEIMIRHFNIFSMRTKFSTNMKPLKDCILMVDGQKWKNQRSYLTPAFSASKMKLMFGLINEQVDKFISIMGDNCQAGEDFDITNSFGALTLDVIGQCALALNVNCQGNSQDEFFLAVRDYLRFAANPATKAAYIFPFLVPLLVFINNNLTAGKMTSMIMSNLEVVIKQRKMDSTQRRLDLLQLMLDGENHSQDSTSKNDGKGLTEDEIVANAYISILAGYETTGSTLGFTAYLLAMHQDIQEKLYQEIHKSIESDHPTYEDVHSLVYLEQVISESLRYYSPVVLFLTRLGAESITVNNIFIPQGSRVLAPVHQLHFDPEYWHEPEVFNPDRFSPENKGNIVAGSYLPFGIGPRNCIGMRFAQMEMKLTLVKLIRNFKLVTSAKTEMPLQLACNSVLISAKNGIYLKLEKRH